MRFSLGTGGAVLRNNRLLMVHHNYEPRVWRIPGGYVKPEEAVHDACIREIFEETQIRTKVNGLLGVRHRINEKDNSTYLIFQLTPIDFHNPIPDQREIDDARYFSLSEIEEFSKDQMPELNRLVARRLLSGTPPLLLSNFGDVNNTNQSYDLYLSS